MPKDIPVIFSGPMVRSLLDGRKTMTRRLAWTGRKAADGFHPSTWRKIEPGDRLWVRESLHADRMENFLTGERTTNAMVAYYSADGTEVVDSAEFNLSWKWRCKSLPSIHMPRSVSRLTLIVNSTKVERLQEISEPDAAAEGWPFEKNKRFLLGRRSEHDPRYWFAGLWKSLYGNSAWDENPEVVAISFSVVRQNIDQIAA